MTTTESPLAFAALTCSKAAIPLSTVIINPSDISSMIFIDNPYPSENRLGSLTWTGYPPKVSKASSKIAVDISPSTS